MPNILSLWPLAVLIAPLSLTIAGARTAWVWLSLAIAGVLLWGFTLMALNELLSGNASPLLEALLGTIPSETAPEGGFSVVALAYALMSIAVPAGAVGIVYFISAHPRRTPFDLALFWIAVALAIGSIAATSVALAQLGKSADEGWSDEGFTALLFGQNILQLLAFGTGCWALCRPILSWWKARGIML